MDQSPKGNPREAERVLLERLKLPETIIVASGSVIKIETVRKALALLFPGQTFAVQGVKASSGINEQPVGDETETGARNRLKNAQELFASEQAGTEAAFVSIENGIFEVAPGEWEDRALALIAFPDGRVYTATSVGVRFPIEDVEKTRELPGGFEKNTVSAFIAERLIAAGIPADRQDAQKSLTDGKLPREHQLIDAVEGALLKAAQES